MNDCLLRGARVIDPSQNIDRVMDIAVKDGLIAAVGADLQVTDSTSVKELSGRLVTPGLIDLHTHIYWGGTSLGVDPNDYASASACTTLVDAGSAGPGNFAGFREHIIAHAQPRICAYLNISFPGIYAFSERVMVGECADMRLLSAQDCVDVADANSDLIIGIKVRIGRVAGGDSGVHPLDVALEVAEELGLPIMCHLDLPPPGRSRVVNRLRPGDVLTHCFRPFPGGPARRDGRVHEEIVHARERGVLFDIGHGKGSFGFVSAQSMLAAGFLPDCISSDVHSLSIDGPAHNLLVTMSKLMHLGMSLSEVVRATTHAPAKVIGQPDLGSLKVGTSADISIIEVTDEPIELEDSTGALKTGQQQLRPHATVCRGVWRETIASLPT